MKSLEYLLGGIVLLTVGCGHSVDNGGAGPTGFASSSGSNSTGGGGLPFNGGVGTDQAAGRSGTATLSVAEQAGALGAMARGAQGGAGGIGSATRTLIGGASNRDAGGSAGEISSLGGSSSKTEWTSTPGGGTGGVSASSQRNVGGSGTGGEVTTGGNATGGTTARGGASSSTGGMSPSTGGASPSSGGGGARGGSTATATGGTTAQGLFPHPLVGFGRASITVESVSREVTIYAPSSASTNPPLVVIFHGTGTSPEYYIEEASIQPVADANGFIVIGGQAIQGRRGSPDDVDHWEDMDYPTGWNIVDENPATNEDVVLTNRIIDEAIAAYDVDPKRVYAMGSSNGAFMAYFAAAALPDRIAAFAEGSGGAMRCQNRGYNGGAQFIGKGTTCAALAQEPGYPQCTGPIEPLRFDTNQRIPAGFLAHANDDDTISVAWSCTLKEYMGQGAEIVIYDGGGHGGSLVFAPDAWKFLTKHSL